MRISKSILMIACILLLLAGCAARGAEPAETGGTELQIYCFQAGKADAFLLTAGDAAMLIDAGEKKLGGDILACLAERNITRLDCLLITHFDKDHVGGAAEVIAGVEIGDVLQGSSPKISGEYSAYLDALEAAGIEPVTVRETYSFTLGGVAYTVEPPRKSSYSGSDSNNSSLIVTVENGGTRMLFAGDAETARLEEFISVSRGTYDFLKVPYHGHMQDGLGELIASAAPKYAVITSSDKEPEDDETVALLESGGAEVFLTRVSPVLLESDGKTLTVRYV